VLRDQAILKKVVDTLDAAQRDLDEAQILYEMAREEGDEAALRDAWAALQALDAKVAALEFQRMLSGPYDRSGALVSINAGAGGVDSQDWAQMLQRMYQRWGERRGFKVELLDSRRASRPASAAPSWRSRASTPTATCARRSACTAWSASALRRQRPPPDQLRQRDGPARRRRRLDVDTEIPDSELRVDKFRASGAGGQHVNKTESAVRLTHLPTGLVVACQLERSQHKNMATAMRMLKAKIFELERQKRDAERQVLEGEKKKIEWGSQIRSYVLQPYQQVNGPPDRDEDLRRAGGARRRSRSAHRGLPPDGGQPRMHRKDAEA
jgi:peptide chain release factor 2